MCSAVSLRPIENPAAQAEFDATYGIFYLGMWGSNLDFGGDLVVTSPRSRSTTTAVSRRRGRASASTSAVSTTPIRAPLIRVVFDYFELKTGGSYTFFEALTLGVTNYWSPDLVRPVTPTRSSFRVSTLSPTSCSISSRRASVVWSAGSGSTPGTDYTYWNAGLTLGFLDNWSADIRYWDTRPQRRCMRRCLLATARVVGTVSASF